MAIPLRPPSAGWAPTWEGGRKSSPGKNKKKYSSFFPAIEFPNAHQAPYLDSTVGPPCREIYEIQIYFLMTVDRNSKIIYLKTNSRFPTIRENKISFFKKQVCSLCTPLMIWSGPSRYSSFCSRFGAAFKENSRYKLIKLTLHR